MVGLKAFNVVPGWLYAAALAASLVMLTGEVLRNAHLEARIAEVQAGAAKLESAKANALLKHEQEKAALIKEHAAKLSNAEKTHAEKVAAVESRARADAATVSRLRKQIADYANRGGTCLPAAAESDGGETAAQVLGGLLAESVELLAEGRALHELRDAEMSLLFEQIDADRAACENAPQGSVRQVRRESQHPQVREN